MKQIADFHIHSRYSRACSHSLVLSKIDETCRIKGVGIIGTGDFTYPAWIKNIVEELEEIDGFGLYKLKLRNDDDVRFVLTTELALIYRDDVRARRIHIVLHAPDIRSVLELNRRLDKDFNIRSDGRPILGMSVPALMKMCFDIHPKFLVYPAHIWTPWFSVFGSKSGFDSFEECFKDYTKDVFAYETGLSSDPEMNWRMSALDNYTLLSNSDAHSLPNIAREATVFDLKEVSYKSIYNSIKNKKNIVKTIEFYPEEGMYHFDGHRDCGVSMAPAETIKHKGACPKCGKDLIIGVDYRVNELADRKKPQMPKNGYGFKKLVELDKIIAECVGVKSRSSKKVQKIYSQMIKDLGPELDILMNVDLLKIENVTNKIVAEGVKRVRKGELIIEPGFDGQYGIVKIFSEDEKEENKQMKLF